MKILLHIGLNKCASTYIQAALADSRRRLASAGTWYLSSGTRTATYGVSKHYGFGPGEADVVPLDIPTLIRDARTRGMSKIIVSSEYLSIRCPAGVKRIADDAARHGADLHVLVYGREIMGWLRSLFNQYVKSVSGAGWLPDFNAFVAQVLRNRAVDISGRVQQWEHVVGPERMTLLHLPDEGAPSSVLRPFEDFSGTLIRPPGPGNHNRSLSIDQLYHIGQLRRQKPSSSITREIAKVSAGELCSPAAPEKFMDINPDLRHRLEREVIAPAEQLDWRALDPSCPLREAS